MATKRLSWINVPLKRHFSVAIICMTCVFFRDWRDANPRVTLSRNPASDLGKDHICARCMYDFACERRNNIFIFKIDFLWAQLNIV